MRARLIVAVMLVLVAVSTTGCKKLEEKFTPPPKVVTIEATVAAPAAKVTGTLSADNPQDLPLWPGAKVAESRMTDDAYSLSLRSADPYTDIVNGTAAGFEKAGWEVLRDEAGDEGARSAILTVSRDGGEGVVTITEIGDGFTSLDYVITPAAQ